MKNLELQFPLPRPHCGMAAGNGCLGLLVWGSGNRLSLTVNRADYWDRRGGELLGEGVTYAKLCAAYDPGAPEKLAAVFSPKPQERPKGWFRSTRLPGGRFELELAPGTELEKAVLEYKQGAIKIFLRQPSGKHQSIAIYTSMRRDLFAITDPGQLIKNVCARPAWEWVGEELAPYGYAPPQKISNENICGWVQACPADPALAALLRKCDFGWCGALELGADALAALAAAQRALQGFTDKELLTLQRELREWWRAFWGRVPRVNLPAGFYNTFLTYALYKFACATNPDRGIACGLQGPWIEEYQTARWGGDYHFNVNIQQIYTLAFPAGLTDHLLPLFNMLESPPFQQVMRRHARILVGIEDGLALTHTTNDRGGAVGGVAGMGASCDHAVCGWLAQLYWFYYKYTGDVQFLRQRAWPFMRGVMRVYEAMLQRRGEQLYLPLGTSAEYRNAVGHTCGPNPSYQLACIHMLCRALLEAAEILGETPAAIWWEIHTKLPRCAKITDKDETRIAIWEGQDLDECHRHHSHLAGIYPFDIFEEPSPELQAIIDNSIDHWLKKGMGTWSEWCIPWAAIIQARFGFSEAPLVLLEMWRRVFVNEGLTTVYLPRFRGVSVHRRADIIQPREKNEIMQLDGTMGAATAIYELLAHTHGGITRIFPATPTEWRNVAFFNLRQPGPFLISAVRRNGVAVRVKIQALADVSIKLDVAGQTQMQLDGRRRPPEKISLPLALKLRAGEIVWLRHLKTANPGA